MTDDIERPGFGESEERSTWSLLRRSTVTISVLVAITLVVAGLSIRLPWYTLSPGSSRSTEPLISVEGAPTYGNDGAVDFLTVSMRQVTPIEVVASWVNPDLELRSQEEVLDKQTPDENRDLNLRMMADSKDAAQYQALARLGYEIPAKGTGAVIAKVVTGSPSEGLLVPGDVVVAVNAEPVMFNQQLVNIVGSTAPGLVLSLKVEPLHENGDGALPARTVEVALGARESDPTKGYLGVSTFTRDLSFDFPVSVTIDSGQVGGPSAGLAFTLGILDVMTPGSLTGGLKVATTGTIALDGSVGRIGGMHQKVITARRRGVQLMLVPRSEIDEARKYANGLRIEPVDSLNEALAVLTTVGGGNSVLPAFSW